MKVSPEFFDIFGLFTFSYLLIIGIWMLRTAEKLPNIIAYTLILISILGLIIDGTIVYKIYIKRK